MKSGAMELRTKRGRFYLHRRPPRIARNPKTGEAVNLSTKIAVHFKPGKEMRSRVVAGRYQCGIRNESRL